MRKFIRIIGILFVVALCSVNMLPSVQRYSKIPDDIYIQNGSDKVIDLGLPVEVDLKSTGVVNIKSERLNATDDISSPLHIETVDNGRAVIDLSLFGLPIKSVNVNVSDEVMVIPGGHSIGVTLYTQGALIVGITGVETESGEIENPARQAGMLPGDVIVEINGEVIEDADHVSKIASKAGSTMHIVVNRNGNKLEFDIRPVKDASDGKMRIGIWVRDSTAGVGTLTFILPDERVFGGLGHAICDLDTGSVLSVKSGEIYFSEIIQVNRAKSGMPGEIQGYFSSSSGNLGVIEKNTQFGIYGKLYDSFDISRFIKPIPAAHRDEVHIGSAQILSSIDNEGVKTFDCEIIKVTEQISMGQKGMVIKITDEELLEKTGGIVQGMSGSPIIQDGKFIGAVTHVFVNNPTKGYGLYADWMISQID